MQTMSVGTAALNAVLGYAVVFVGLILLMCVILILGKIMAGSRAETRPQASAPVSGSAASAAAPAAALLPTAPGTAGELKLYDTDPKAAAMIMAIVADELKTPLNELRFKSIKEVK